MSQDYCATPEQWDDVAERAADCQGGYSCLLELRARVERLEATQHAHIDTSSWTLEEREQALAELRMPTVVKRIAEMEGNCQAALDSSAPAIEPPELSNREVLALSERPPGSETPNDRIRRIYRTGWDAAIRAVADWLVAGGLRDGHVLLSSIAEDLRRQASKD